MSKEIGTQVLDFYKDCPFNTYSSAESAVENILSFNQIEAAYPDLHRLLKHPSNHTVLDAGCGGGWFSLSSSHYYGVTTTGVDFNESALSISRDAAKLLKVETNFQQIDLLEIGNSWGKKFDLVVSIGVLHHTGNMFKALENISTLLSDSPNSRLYVGLYHKYGRKPFLDLFQEMKEQAATEEEMFNAYAKLHSSLTDEQHLRSWFRDQVLHPHETQHTLKELNDWLIERDFIIESTSINRFAPISNLEQLFELEQSFQELSYQRNVVEKQYYPGFFTFCAKKST